MALLDDPNDNLDPEELLAFMQQNMDLGNQNDENLAKLLELLQKGNSVM